MRVELLHLLITVACALSERSPHPALWLAVSLLYAELSQAHTDPLFTVSALAGAAIRLRWWASNDFTSIGVSSNATATAAEASAFAFPTSRVSSLLFALAVLLLLANAVVFVLRVARAEGLTLRGSPSRWLSMLAALSTLLGALFALSTRGSQSPEQRLQLLTLAACALIELAMRAAQRWADARPRFEQTAWSQRLASDGEGVGESLLLPLCALAALRVDLALLPLDASRNLFSRALLELERLTAATAATTATEAKPP